MQLLKFTAAFLATGGTIYALVHFERAPHSLRILLTIGAVLGVVVAAWEAYDAAEHIAKRVYPYVESAWHQIKWNAPKTGMSEAEKAELRRRHEEEIKSLLAQPWKTVCTTARNADEAKQQLDAAKMQYVRFILDMVPEWSQSRTCYRLTPPLPGRLLAKPEYSLKWSNEYSEMVATAKTYGLSTCPWEVIVPLRIAMAQQEDGEALHLATEPRGRDGFGGMRIPLIGNKMPKDNGWAGTPFAGRYLSVKVLGPSGEAMTERSYIFCAK